MPDSAFTIDPLDPRHGRPRHRTIPNRRGLEMWRQQEERERGVPMATTPEAIVAAHRTADHAEITIADQRKRGKDVLEELLPLLMSFVAIFQPWPPSQGPNPYENRELFDRYVNLVIKCASSVAPYQSPKAFLIRDERARPEDELDLTRLTDEELSQWRTLLIKAKRGPTIDQLEGT